MTEIKPCAVKGCTSTKQHHHDQLSGALFQCPQGGGSRCSRPNGAPWVTPLVAPRLTRKALNARIAALEAENADLHAEIADKKDRLARCEGGGAIPVMWAVVDDQGVDLGSVRKCADGGFDAFSLSAPFTGRRCDTISAAIAAVADPDAEVVSKMRAAYESAAIPSDSKVSRVGIRAALKAAREAGAL